MCIYIYMYIFLQMSVSPKYFSLRFSGMVWLLLLIYMGKINDLEFLVPM